MLEFKNIRLDREGVEGRMISGYASVFGNIDKVGDIVEKGAFKKTLRERGKRIKFYYNHTHPLGLPVKIGEDDTGLFAESKVSKTWKGDEVLELVKDGVIDEMSIAYEVMQYDPRKNGGRNLKELKLHEFGPVDFGANDKAVILGVKNLINNMEKREVDEDLYNEVKDCLQKLESMISYKKEEPSEDTQESLQSTLVKKLYESEVKQFERFYEALTK